MSVMANRLSLHEELSALMETMVKSTLKQVCRLVDEDSTSLQMEISRLLQTNSALVDKVSSLECELSIVRTDAPKLNTSSRSVGVQTVHSKEVSEPVTIDGIFGKEWCVNLWEDKEPNSAKQHTQSSPSSEEECTAVSILRYRLLQTDRQTRWQLFIKDFSTFNARIVQVRSLEGFTTVSLLSYLNLERSANGYFNGVKQQKGQSFQLNSKVVTVTISNRNASHLKEPVNITLYHLVQSNQTSHTCVFWDASMKGGAWSTRGCKAVESNQRFTVCSCSHLSSFAVLMTLYDMEDIFELQLITVIGLTLSLVCLFFCILTFSMIRSIQNARTTIHLHLCISLFIAILIFLTCISQTQNQIGCAVIAALLHFFFLASFCWMCLEGIQLFRMVVLVFNTSFKPLYMFAGGYGVPAIIVGISALVNAKGYGTPKYCWLNLEIIWSFFGPASVIIIVNIFFFLITVWKLGQKLSSLNPDLNNLQKIKTFTITAVAQLCVLGTMWIFGCFQFEGSSVVISYLFTIFGSLQGVMLFFMHCLLSKQVRDEYANIFCRCCAPQKKPYSEFSHSSKAHTSKSSHDTGESHI